MEMGHNRANRIMKVLPDVEITTTHSYEIAFKFRWRCSSSTCGKIFGRHSNSINVDTHGCPCGSKLVRIDKEGNVFKPKQGGGGGATTVATVLEENDRGEMVETPVKQKKKNGWLEFVAVSRWAAPPRFVTTIVSSRLTALARVLVRYIRVNHRSSAKRGLTSHKARCSRSLPNDGKSSRKSARGNLLLKQGDQGEERMID